MSGSGNYQEFQTVEMRKELEESNKENSDAGSASGPNSTTAPPSASKTMLYPRPYADPYDSRKYFATRPGAFDQAMDDLKAHVMSNMGETAHSFWLLAEVDHWNNEKERVAVITDSALLICKYDFIMLKCLQLQRIPLSYINRVCLGSFTFPERSLDKREGEGLRIFWDKQQEPSFLSRWNPWSTDVPYATFTEHPVKNINQRFSTICQIPTFTAQLVQAVQNAQRTDPAPGQTGRVVVANEPILIETYTGLMSFLGNRNKLGYSLARGSFGF
ncbi:tumor protein p63-regulated gene 1 protein isoform X2 [Rhineura floridana]|nr:tumor protein p63-regulated gene 1 protein isoform X2 [Rhineura floridana]XP_061493597.1 tumor protein p63-regulated gene 1 protein isoform X2 [Rhineura floridana]